LTASTFECLLDEPFELLLALAPLLELRGLLALLLLDFALDFVALGFDADFDFDFEAGFAVFEADDLLDFGFDLAFGFELDLGLSHFPLSSGVSLLAQVPNPMPANQHECGLAALLTTSKALPGMRFSWFRSSSSQRRSLLPEKNQLDPLSATISP
jgi:hypothetical protein